MKWTNAFDLFLFDFDGLLVNTEPLHFEAYKRLAKYAGHSIDWTFDEYVQIAHTSHDGLKNNLDPHLRGDWGDLYEKKKQLYLELLQTETIDLMPGAKDLLNHLAEEGKKRCVVTHSPRGLVERIKVKHPVLETIPVWLTREDYDQPKPAPDGYLKALELLRDPRDRVVGFEDSLRGIESLQGAGVRPLLICPKDHPQLTEERASAVEHFTSLSKISLTS